MTKQEDEEDMTMDEILASIRKYVTEDQTTPRDLYGVPAQPLRKNESYSVDTDKNKSQDHLTDYNSPYTSTESRDTLAYSSVRHQAEPSLTLSESTTGIASDDLKKEFGEQAKGVSSEATISAAASAFSKLDNLKTEFKGHPLTLDGLITDLARPLIKEWMDHHLSHIVEKMVAKEIERIRLHGK